MINMKKVIKYFTKIEMRQAKCPDLLYPVKLVKLL